MFTLYGGEAYIVKYMKERATKARRHVRSRRHPDGTALARSQGSTLDSSSESRQIQEGEQTNEVRRPSHPTQRS